MSNRFRDPTLRKEYDSAMAMFRAKHRNLFLADGSRPATPGNSFAAFFWRGYDGTNFGAGFTDRASRQTLGYAYWRAGQDARAAAWHVVNNDTGESCAGPFLTREEAKKEAQENDRVELRP
jgi:hypothetical protein